MRKFLRYLGIGLLIAALVIVVLVKAFGLRVELYGNGMKPHFYFYKPEAHYAAIEQSRAEQKTPEPEATPSSVPAAIPAPLSYWTDFRGPRRDGIYDQTPVASAWPADGLRLLWKQPVGGGYASFVVGQAKAYTIEQRRDKEVVAAYDLRNGRELWNNSWIAHFDETMGGDGPRATPTYSDGRVYALGAAGEFRCLDADSGKMLWSHNILTENQATNLQWGMSASPLIVEGQVIVLPGGAGGKSVAAYDKLTGKLAWTALDDRAGYASPELATLAGERQIIVVTAERVVGLNGAGATLWAFPWRTDYGVNSAQPVVIDNGRFFISSGYDHGGSMVEVTKTGDTFAAKEIWHTNRMKNRFNTSVYYNGFLYGLDEGILACLDASNGELKWKGGRYGYGQLLLASGSLIVLTEDGDLALVKATPEKLDEVARFSAIDGKTWNYPAIDGGRLLVRNTTQMAAFKLP